MATPQPTKNLDFYEALKRVARGDKVTKKEWGDKNTFIYIANGMVSLHKNKKIHGLLVSEGDLQGKDWVVLND